jgi:hypothetical protein
VDVADGVERQADLIEQRATLGLGQRDPIEDRPQQRIRDRNNRPRHLPQVYRSADRDPRGRPEIGEDYVLFQTPSELSVSLICRISSPSRAEARSTTSAARKPCAFISR